ncbi:MAG: hypothetical protein LLG45_13375 [Actinomycetia bacterium]|nr:hypothetical protein [Actinomycetes bacterium]
MPSGHPLTREQKEFIDRNVDKMLINQMARELHVERKTVKRYLKGKGTS